MNPSLLQHVHIDHEGRLTPTCLLDPGDEPVLTILNDITRTTFTLAAHVRSYRPDGRITVKELAAVLGLEGDNMEIATLSWWRSETSEGNAWCQITAGLTHRPKPRVTKWVHVARSRVKRGDVAPSLPKPPKLRTLNPPGNSKMEKLLGRAAPGGA